MVEATYYERNKDRIRRRVKEYYEKNKDNISKKSKKYRERNINKIKKRKKEYYEENKDKINEQKKKYYEKNKDKFFVNHINYRKKNRTKILKQRKGYREKNKEKIRVILKEYRDNNKQKVRKMKRKYYLENKDEIYKKHLIYLKDRLKNDLNFKILQNLRRRLNHAIKGENKSKRTIELLGANVSIIKEHLEKQFKQGMGWDNYGKVWHIDHRTPCSWFDLSKKKEQEKCFHYTNLQPLFVKDNLLKNNCYAEPTLLSFIEV